MSVQRLKGKRILLVLAHPDDEVIFGWPLLQEKELDVSLMICSSDRYNEQRKWCSHRKDILADLCAQRGIRHTCLDYNSGFYRLETRDETLSRALQEIQTQIRSFSPDIIFTHNPLGEYGHIDHILIHQCVVNMDFDVLVSDIFLASNWVPYKSIQSGLRNIYFKSKVASCALDFEFYRHWEKAYRDAGVWTWCFEPVASCNLFLLPGKATECEQAISTHGQETPVS
jgi:LmbE family N-acetylglucosaminyl deacetylase